MYSAYKNQLLSAWSTVGNSAARFASNILVFANHMLWKVGLIMCYHKWTVGTMRVLILLTLCMTWIPAWVSFYRNSVKVYHISPSSGETMGKHPVTSAEDCTSWSVCKQEWESNTGQVHDMWKTFRYRVNQSAARTSHGCTSVHHTLPTWSTSECLPVQWRERYGSVLGCAQLCLEEPGVRLRKLMVCT